MRNEKLFVFPGVFPLKYRQFLIPLSKNIILSFFHFLIFIYLCIQMKHSFLISAPTSGSGKTTIARGLMALLVKKGMRVQPFKCGPDYIDTKFHAAVCGRPSINLDTFMASREHVKELFVHYGADADVCMVEGMMGLFDGYDRDKGSSAEIASVLNVPVVLVVDAKSPFHTHLLPILNSQLSTVNCQLSTLNSQHRWCHFQQSGFRATSGDASTGVRRLASGVFRIPSQASGVGTGFTLFGARLFRRGEE